MREFRPRAMTNRFRKLKNGILARHRRNAFPARGRPEDEVESHCLPSPRRPPTEAPVLAERLGASQVFVFESGLGGTGWSIRRQSNARMPANRCEEGENTIYVVE